MKRPSPALAPALFAALAVGAGLLLLRWPRLPDLTRRAGQGDVA